VLFRWLNEGDWTRRGIKHTQRQEKKNRQKLGRKFREENNPGKHSTEVSGSKRK
jgi:hypothetical protein